MSDPDTLFNASLNKILKHWGDSEYIIAACGRNDDDFKKLKTEIKSLGFAFVQVEGIGQDDEIITHPALLVLNHTKRSDFLTAMLKLAMDRQRGAFVHSPGDGIGAVIKPADFIVFERSSIRNAVAEYFAVMLDTDLSSKLKGLRRAFPESHIEGVSRQVMGEGLPVNSRTET